MNNILNILYGYLKDSIMVKPKIKKYGFEHYCCSLKKYAHKEILNVDKLNLYIIKKIEENKPFLMARFGSVELFCASMFEFDVNIKKDKSMSQLCQCAGFFPHDLKLGDKFNTCLKDNMKQIDVLGFWGLRFEEYYIKKYFSDDVRLTFLLELEPWRNPKNPWTKALKGKKVLIIHPFENTIKNQYQRREHIFPDTEILPEFELKTLKAVQTIAGQKDDRFDTWFDALEYMFNEAMKIDFDVAILGCGAYGMPLAAKLKQAGKQAVHLGGATQILFGIKGKRWDTQKEHEYVRKLYNEYWVYPDETEKPKNASVVEGGCYW